MSKIPLDSIVNSKGINASLELFLNWFYANFDNGSIGKRIVNTEFLHYTGLIAGSEFLAYAATKLYLCYTIQIFNGTNHGETEGSIIFYSPANAAFLNVTNKSAYWESLGAKDEFMMNPIAMENFYFSRITNSIYDSIIFNGYRMTLQ